MILNRNRAIAVAAATCAAVGTAGIGSVMSASSKNSSGDSGNSGATNTPAPPADSRHGFGPGGMDGRRPPGHRRPPLSDAQLEKIAEKLGISTAELKSAITEIRKANRPNAGDRPDRGKALAAALATELGAGVSDVQEILEANRPQRPQGGPPQPGTRPDHSELISALAKGLGKTESEVKAALEKAFAAHSPKHKNGPRGAHFEELAKRLGLKVEDVKSAFEAVLPKPPAHPGKPS